jgi:hypothetical protein
MQPEDFISSHRAKKSMRPEWQIHVHVYRTGRHRNLNKMLQAN